MSDVDIEQRNADLERRESVLRADRLKFELRGALAAAKCRPDGIDDALAVLGGLLAPEFNSDGRISKLMMGADAFDTPAKAIAAFMATRPHWATPVEPVASETSGSSAKPAQEESDSSKAPIYGSMDLVSRGWLKPPL